MKNDPEKLGSNSDGSPNQEYCLYCYQNGSFTQPNFLAKDMQEFCIEKMKEMGFPKFIGWLFTRSIPKLKRWSASMNVHNKHMKNRSTSEHVRGQVLLCM